MFGVIRLERWKRSAPGIGWIESREYSWCTGVGVVGSIPERYDGPPQGGLRNTTSILRDADLGRDI